MPDGTHFDLSALDGNPLAILKPLITNNVVERTLELLGLDGEDRDEKLALMLARAVNPVQHYNNDQEGTLRGIGRKKVGRAKARGEITGP